MDDKLLAPAIDIGTVNLADYKFVVVDTDSVGHGFKVSITRRL
jgi:hypothetical protein